MTLIAVNILGILCKKIKMFFMEVLIKFKIGLVSNRMVFVHILDKTYHSLMNLTLFKMIKTTIVMMLQHLMFNVKIGISNSKIIKINLLLSFLL